MQKNCDNCGCSLDNDEAYCPRCGARIEDVSKRKPIIPILIVCLLIGGVGVFFVANALKNKPEHKELSSKGMEKSAENQSKEKSEKNDEKLNDRFQSMSFTSEKNPESYFDALKWFFSLNEEEKKEIGEQYPFEVCAAYRKNDLFDQEMTKKMISYLYEIDCMKVAKSLLEYADTFEISRAEMQSEITRTTPDQDIRNSAMRLTIEGLFKDSIANLTWEQIDEIQYCVIDKFYIILSKEPPETLNNSYVYYLDDSAQNLSKSGSKFADTNISQDLSQMHGLRELTVEDAAFAAEELFGLPQLKKLSLASVRAVGFKNICTYQNLESLSIDLLQCEVTGIQSLSNLKTLEINYFSQVAGFGEISKLSQLEHLTLDIADSEININPISNLKDLKTLSLKGSEISEVAFISDLHDLRELVIEETSIQSAEFLSKLNLEVLILINNEGLEDVSGLGKNTNLKTLAFEVSGKAEYDVNDIGKLINLENLTIYSPQNIGFLQNLKDLKTLKISLPHNVNNLAVLKNCSQLESLIMFTDNNNMLFDGNLSAIGELKSLKVLSLSKVAFYGDSNGIFTNPSLESLTIDDSIINASYTKEWNLPRLKYLSLSKFRPIVNGRISGWGGFYNISYDDIESDTIVKRIKELKGLEHLFYSSAKLTNCDFVASLPKLKTLDLHDNQISDISEIVKLQDLEIVDLSGNLIKDWSLLDEKSNIQIIKQATKE